MSEFKFINLGDGTRISTRYICLVQSHEATERTKNYTAEIRALGASGGLVQHRFFGDVVKDLKALDVELTMLPSRKAAVRPDWITAADPFEKPGVTILEFTHPDTGAQHYAEVPDRPEQIPGANTAFMIGRPGGPSPKDGP
jgi:hypothetical protein